MLKTIDIFIKNHLFYPKKETAENTEIQDNPLFGYLKIYENQHRILFVLYRGLIVTFSCFLLLISYLIFNLMDNQLFPGWAIYTFYGIDILLAVGVVKAVIELKKYQRKSHNLMREIKEHLKKDLGKLEKIKSEHNYISNTHKKIQQKIKSIGLQTKKPEFLQHEGWDFKTCPHCHSKVELTEDTCSHCQQHLGETLEN
ncbi:MAG: hypothetical protein OEY59_00735 [Deltaproteobacteria bacterium]|nr:hypothetical protein [Deltaproteobacteria bacterium]